MGGKKFWAPKRWEKKTPSSQKIKENMTGEKTSKIFFFQILFFQCNLKSFVLRFAPRGALIKSGQIFKGDKIYLRLQTGKTYLSRNKPAILPFKKKKGKNPQLVFYLNGACGAISLFPIIFF